MIDSGRRALPGLLFAVLLLVVYADPLFTRRNFAGRDLLGYNLPVEKAVHDAYSRGRWPVWIDEVSGGRPLLANINVGALYPLRAVLSPLPFPVAMRIYPVLHWLIAGIGTMLLLTACGCSRPAAWAGAVTYVFSGVGVSEIFYTNHHPGVSLLPWIVWAVARLRRGGVPRIVVASFLIGLDLLAGDVFTTGLALVACVLWVLLEEERDARGPALAALGASILLSLLLALPQLVATLLWIPQTRRAITGMTVAGSLRFSVSPWRLLEWIIPYPFGPTWADEARGTWAPAAFGGLPMGFFATLHVGAFAALATVRCWRGGGRGARFARGLALFGLIVCVLPSLVPVAWSTWKAPIPLRYPEKMVVALELAAAVFAGIGFDRFRAFKAVARWPLAVGAVLALLAGAARLWPYPAGRFASFLLEAGTTSTQVAAAYLPGSLAEAGLLWMAGVVALDRLGIQRRFALATALVLTTAAPIVANRWIAHSYSEEDVFAPPAFVRAINRRDAGGGFRTISESRYISPSRFEAAQLSSDVGFLDYRRRSWLFYTSTLWERGVVFNDDYDAGDFSRLDSLRRLSIFAWRFAHPEAFFENLSLRFGNRFPDQSPPPGFQRFGGTGFEIWDQDPNALPDMRLLESWVEESGAVPALAAIPTLKTGQVTLETGRQGWRSARPGVLHVVIRSPERLSIETHTPDPTFLFVLRGFWPHRSVMVDGAEAAVVPAQLAFSAVPVPAGRHRIEWIETVPGGSISRWAPVLYVTIAISLFLRRRRSMLAAR